MERAIWKLAEKLLRDHGDMAEHECAARESYHVMRWDMAGAARWRRRAAFVRRLRNGERPPLALDEAVAAGRFHDYVAQQNLAGGKIAALEAELTGIVRALIRQRVAAAAP